jgi:hypothetical protein
MPGPPEQRAPSGGRMTLHDPRPHEGPEEYQFTDQELTRLARYRLAVQAGFYSDWPQRPAMTVSWPPRDAATNNKDR